MADYRVESYKRAVNSAVERWSEKVAKIAKELDAIAEELDKLETALAYEETYRQKRIEELKKQRKAIPKRMETAAQELKISLLMIPPVEAEGKEVEKQLKELPAWLKEIVKKKGIPLGKHVTLVPDVSVDFKEKKLKTFGLTLKWEF